MIEKITKDYLSGEMYPIPVHTEKPEHPPDEYILIEKTGGGSENFISDARIAIQSYAGSLYRAAALNEEVKEKMKDIIILDSISKATLNSNYNYPDTTKKQHRYQAVYDLVFFE